MAQKEFPDLAKRQQEVRGAPAPPVALTVQLSPQQFRSLAEAAAEQGMSVEDYAAWIINQWTVQTEQNPGEVQ
jgi:predicted HicB family RNase H-like nuclease